jgi:GntR family transcriptional regulator of arabinose operon
MTELKFKYQRLKLIIEEKIDKNEYRKGEQLPSERELSEIYKVSRVSVRTVLNQLEREGKIFRVPGRGTFAGRSTDMASQKVRSGFIGLTTLGCDDERSRTNHELLLGINRVLATTNYHLVYAGVGTDLSFERQTIEDLIRKNIDGLIITPVYEGHKDNSAYYRELVDRKIPFVVVNRPVTSELWSSVLLDNSDAIAEAVKFFVSKGHRKIGYVGPTFYTMGRIRYEAYLAALSGVGLEFNPDLAFISGSDESSATYTAFDFAKKAAKEFLRRAADFTALVCFNDEIAYIVWNELMGSKLQLDAGRCISGFEFMSIGDPEFQKSLISFRRPFFKAGEYAGKALIEQIESMVPVAGKTVVLPSDMVIPAVNPRENKVIVSNDQPSIKEVLSSKIETSKEL